MNMTLTKEQHDEAHHAYVRDCKKCLWDTAAGGMPYINHVVGCDNVVPHVVNNPSKLRGIPAMTVPLEKVYGADVNQPVVHEAVGTMRPTAYVEAKQTLAPMSSEVPMTPGGLVEFFDYMHRSNVRLMKSKNADYANAADAFFNLRRGGEYGIIIRMDDKVSRLLNLLKEGASSPKVDESIDDTLRDLGIYSTLCLAMRHEARQRRKIVGDHI